MTKTSLLRDFEPEIIGSQDLDDLKQKFTKYIQDVKMPPRDRAKMIVNIRSCATLEKIQFLFYNSLLKFENLGVLSFN